MTRFQKSKRVPCFGTPKHAFEYESMAPIIQTWSLFVRWMTKPRAARDATLMMCVAEHALLGAEGLRQHFLTQRLPRRSLALNAAVLQAEDMMSVLAHNAKIVGNL